LRVDGEHVAITGILDLVCSGPAQVEIVDFETNQSRRAEAEYRKQLRVYYHVLASEYPDREVTASLFYSAEGELVTVDTLSEADLDTLVDT